MRTSPSETLVATGVVAVLRAPKAELYRPVVDVLVAAGVRSIELTLTTPGTIRALPELIAAVPDAEIGVGTVLRTDDARAALDAGAEFLVSPSTMPDIITLAESVGAPVYPGAMTPTEVHAAWEHGASAVKIFPASTLGPDYVRQLAGPLPDVLTLPSGGITLDAIPTWIRAGCIAVSLGGPLIGDAFAEGNLEALAHRARQAVHSVAEARHGS